MAMPCVKKRFITTRTKELMRDYYEHYYRVQLGLVDWQDRIENRLQEEKYLGESNLDKVQKWLGASFVGKRVLVVGAGTGAESIVFHKRHAKIYAVEPNARALEILRLKADFHGIPRDRFRKATAEHLPYKRNSFDFVYCYTVLEHVQDVDKSISEMVRVCKTGGMIFIATPDYRFPYEGHYKVNRPGFSSKWLTLFLLWIRRRPTKFLLSVNFVNAPQLDKIFLKHNVITYRVNPPWLFTWRGVRNAQPFARFTERFGFGKDQIIFLKKLGNES